MPVTLDSSHIASVDWEGGTMVVQFKDGAEYEYRDVPAGLYYEFLGSASKGRFFKDNVKGQFEFSKREK